jgi:hypothetical protein
MGLSGVDKAWIYLVHGMALHSSRAVVAHELLLLHMEAHELLLHVEALRSGPTGSTGGEEGSRPSGMSHCCSIITAPVCLWGLHRLSNPSSSYRVWL